MRAATPARHADLVRAALRDVTADALRNRTPRHSYRFARIHASLREPDAAFASLEKAVRERDENVVWLNVDPHLDNVRGDPRFANLVRRLGFVAAKHVE